MISKIKKCYIFAGLTILMWGTTPAVVKSLMGSMSDFQTLTVSAVVAAVFLLVYNIISGNISSMKKYRLKDYLIMAGLGFIGLFVYDAMYYYGLSVMSSQEACILNYLWPIMIVLFSCIILKEKLTVRKAIAMVLSFSGIVIIMSGNQLSTGSQVYFGIAACVLAAVCYGLFSVLNKKYDYDQNIVMMILWAVTAVCSGVVCVIRKDWSPITSPISWAGLIWLGVFIDAIAYLLWALALAGEKNTAKIANLAYLTPIVSVVVSTVFFKEPLSVTALVALAFIIGGILIQNIKLKKNK